MLKSKLKKTFSIMLAMILTLGIVSSTAVNVEASQPLHWSEVPVEWLQFFDLPPELLEAMDMSRGSGQSGQTQPQAQPVLPTLPVQQHQPMQQTTDVPEGYILHPTGILKNIYEVEREIYRLTNIERARVGLHPLIWCDYLAEAARSHSDDLVANNIMGHIGSDGSTVLIRVQRTNSTMTYVGENVTTAVGGSAESALNSWMNSPGHKANLLHAGYTHIGVGFSYVEGIGFRYTQKFGSN